MNLRRAMTDSSKLHHPGNDRAGSMRLPLVLWVGAIGAVVAVGVTGIGQYRRVASLQGEVAELRESVSDWDSLSAAVCDLRAEDWDVTVAVDPAELESLRAEESELLQLRGEVTRLRRAQHIDPAIAESEATRLQALADEKRQEADVLIGTVEIEQENEAARKRLQDLWFAAHRSAANNQFPRSRSELRSNYARWFGQQFPQQNWEPAFAWFETEQGGQRAVLDVFEFYSLDHTPTAIDGPPRIVIRERQPRRGPDGLYWRIYKTSRGTDSVLRSDDLDFSNEERAFEVRLGR